VPKGRIAPGSLVTFDDQLRLYREQMGREAAERQQRLADAEAGRCVCTPTPTRGRWEGSKKATLRRVHERSCPRWKPWMAEP
jgi:hypothetical protein